MKAMQLLGIAILLYAGFDLIVLNNAGVNNVLMFVVGLALVLYPVRNGR
jgi:hypothetical protein